MLLFHLTNNRSFVYLTPLVITLGRWVQEGNLKVSISNIQVLSDGQMEFCRFSRIVSLNIEVNSLHTWDPLRRGHSELYKI